MTKSKLVLATVLSSMMIVGVQTKPPVPAGLSYADAKIGFSVQLVPGFKREGNLDPMGNVQFSGPVDGGTTGSIAVLGFPCENETAETIGKAAVSQVQSDENYKIVSSGPLKPGGVPSYTWLYERKLATGSTVMQRGFVSVKKGTAAVINFMVDKSAFQKYDKSSLEMMNSFKWTK